mgnify:CR=1 FL=1
MSEQARILAAAHTPECAYREGVLTRGLGWAR